MPISSGAEGHVGVGVNTSIKWIPEGGEEHQGVRISNSYLQRYLYHVGDGKIKPEEKAKWSRDTERIHKTQNKQAPMKESSNFQQNGKTYNKVQKGPLKDTHSTTYTQEQSTKAVKEDSSTAPSKKPTTSTTELEKKATASTNAPAKKSSVCIIL